MVRTYCSEQQYCILRQNEFEVSLAGSRGINLNVSAQYIESTLVGTENIKLKGSTTNSKVKITGSDDFFGRGV